ncbi:MAG: signal peptide peptidase SppA, partial [Tepidisphaeraceae bacterium]
GYRPPPGMQPPPGQYPPMMPPPMFMAPPPAPRERSFARAIFMTLATTIFGLSLAANIYLLLFSGLMAGGASARQSTIVDGDPTQRVAVIPVSGIIDAEAAQQFDRFMKIAEEDKHVKAVVIEIDSPGGTVTASDEMHHRVAQFKLEMAKQNRNVPVVTAMASVAASGGYYLACATDFVFAQPTTITGSIGVIAPRLNVSRLADKWGIEDRSIVATGADYKDAGSSFKPEEPNEIAYIQALIDQSFGRFKEVVDKGRKGKLTSPLAEVANGKVFLGPEALTLGLVDQVGYLEDAYLHAGKGLTRMQVVRYQNPPSLLEALSARSNVGAVNASPSGINVQLDWQKLLELSTPRMLYLWRGE